MTVGVLNVGGIYSLIDVTIHDSINKHWWGSTKREQTKAKLSLCRFYAHT